MTDTLVPKDLTPPGAVIGAGDIVEAAGHPVGGGVIKPDYDPRLTNEDLAPLGKQIVPLGDPRSLQTVS